MAPGRIGLPSCLSPLNYKYQVPGVYSQPNFRHSQVRRQLKHFLFFLFVATCGIHTKRKKNNYIQKQIKFPYILLMRLSAFFQKQSREK